MEGPPLLGFSGIPAGWLPLEEGFPLLKIFRHPAGGVVGSRPDRRVTFLRGQESNQRNRRGPLPAPWTPGAVVPDLRPLLAFSLEPSSGLSAAWVNTRLPPPFGCWNWEGAEFGGWVFYGGRQRADRTSPALRATSPFQGEAKRGGRWPFGFRSPASPLGGRVGRGVHLISPRREF